MKKFLLIVSACMLAFAANAETEEVDLSAFSVWGESDTFDATTLTATFTDAWSGGGCWWGEKDLSAYSTFTLEFESSAFGVKLGLQDLEYGDLVVEGIDQSGITSISVVIPEGSFASQFYMQNYASGSITLTKAYFTLKGDGPLPETPYVDPVLGKLASVWGTGNKVVGKTMTFGESDSGIGFANYDGGFDLSQYKSIIVELEEFPTWASYGQIVVIDIEDNATKVSFDGATATVDLTAIEGGIKQIYLQCGGTGDVTLKEITFSTEAPVVPEPAYVDPILGTLSVVWGANSISGKVMTFGESDSGIGFANYDGGFDLSQYESVTIELEEFPAWAEYGQIVVMSGAEGKTASKFPFEGTVATINIAELDGNATQIYLQCGWKEGEGGNVTLKEITFNEKGTGTAVEDVAGTSFSIEGGMLFSKGTINVYDFNGKFLQSANKELNVNDLGSGSYIIKAQEGSIKFVK